MTHAIHKSKHHVKMYVAKSTAHLNVPKSVVAYNYSELLKLQIDFADITSETLYIILMHIVHYIDA